LHSISTIRHFYDLLDAAAISCADYQVIETACDQCIAMARHVLHAQLDQRELS
jgi:hypothetical protein